MNEKAIFSQSVTKQDQTYIFEILKPEENEYSLRISEIQTTESGIDKRQITISGSNSELFFDAFQTSIKEFRKMLPPQPKEATSRAAFLEKLREKHGQAFMPWSQEDDGQLERLYCEGKTVSELSRLFGRQNGAIRARIKKLELEEKYPG